MSHRKRQFLKVILAGEAGVGKTSLRRAYLGESFVKQHLSTIGADFSSMKKQIKDKIVNFQIWDLAGQEFFENVRMMYYRGALGALCVWDVTEIESLADLERWIGELEKNTGRGIVPFIILGNKIDLLDDNEKKLIREKAKDFVDKYNKMFNDKGFKVDFYETSAKTGENVDKAFEDLGEKIIDYIEFRREMRNK